MKELLDTLATWTADGTPGDAVGRAVVVRTFGSAPRPEGAVLLYAADGRIAGSVSGGCVEGAAAEEIDRARTTGQARVMRSGIGDEEAWDVGLACGAPIDVLVEPVAPAVVIEAARGAVGAGGHGSAVITPLPDDSPPPEFGAYPPGDGAPPASELIVTEDGTLTGTLGPPELDATLVAEAQAALKRGLSRTIEVGGRQLFVEVFPVRPRLVVVGGVEVARSLVRLARELGFETVVVDGRAAFATKERFPDVDRLGIRWPDEGAHEIGPRAEDAGGGPRSPMRSASGRTTRWRSSATTSSSMSRRSSRRSSVAAATSAPSGRRRPRLTGVLAFVRRVSGMPTLRGCAARSDWTLVVARRPRQPWRSSPRSSQNGMAAPGHRCASGRSPPPSGYSIRSIRSAGSIVSIDESIPNSTGFCSRAGIAPPTMIITRPMAYSRNAPKSVSPSGCERPSVLRSPHCPNPRIAPKTPSATPAHATGTGDSTRRLARMMTVATVRTARLSQASAIVQELIDRLAAQPTSTRTNPIAVTVAPRPSRTPNAFGPPRRSTAPTTAATVAPASASVNRIPMIPPRPLRSRSKTISMRFQTPRTARTVAAPVSITANGPGFREVVAMLAATSVTIAAASTSRTKSVDGHAPNGRPRIVRTIEAIEPPKTSFAIGSSPDHAATTAAVPTGAAGVRVGSVGSSVIANLPVSAAFGGRPFDGGHGTLAVRRWEDAEMATRTAALVLAAGAGSRFGGGKLLASVGGRPVLQHVLDAVAGAGIDDVVVVLGAEAPAIEAAIAWRGERRVLNPAPERGLSSSLKTGFDAVPDDVDAVLVALGDQPLVPVETIRALLDAPSPEDRPVVVPAFEEGQGRNPVLLRRPAFALVAETEGDRGLGPVIAGHPESVAEVAVSDHNPAVDTIDDLAAVLESAWAKRVRANREQVERLREVPDGQDFYAPVTSLFRADPTRTGDDVLDVLLGLVRSGDTWLDVGAGAGRFALSLARALDPSGVSVVALDPSRSMLEGLREIAEDYAIENVRVVEARWPPDGSAAGAFDADVALIAHVGYDIEDIGGFLTALEDAAERLCVA